jgi:hypothetical protein
MHVDRLTAVLCILLLGCGGEVPEPIDDRGSLCACRELDGETECCFGHGVCAAQPEGPDRCECDPGAQGDTCSTPAPGVHAVRPRACEGDDPGCHRVYENVVVENFDECVDLGGSSFASIIVRPAIDDAGGWPASPLPVAVLTHGASQHAADYYDLLEHVAANGIAMAAFDATVGEDVTFRANRLLSYLECLRLEWGDADRLTDRYALVGHSRGGAAVAIAAEAIASGLAADGVEVEAVVALAPSEMGQAPIMPTTTRSYFTLQGSRDPDTKGAALGWFDLAGGDPSLVRGISWVFGATHQRFHQGLLAAGTGELEASLSAEGHWTVARAYVGGFLIWRLLGHDSYRSSFTGETIPASVASFWDGDTDVFTGLADGTVDRLVVHDFEAAELSPSSVGGVTEAIGFDGVTIGPLADLDAPWSSAHRSGGIRLDWSAATQPVLRFELPLASQDLSAFAVVSLRVARVFDAAGDCAQPSTSDDLALVLADGQSELALPLSAAPPDRFVPETFGNWATAGCHAQDFLVPRRFSLQLACDAGLDLASVTSIELRVDGSVGGGVLIDDLVLERGEGESAGCG